MKRQATQLLFITQPHFRWKEQLPYIYKAIATKDSTELDIFAKTVILMHCS